MVLVAILIGLVVLYRRVVVRACAAKLAPANSDSDMAFSQGRSTSTSGAKRTRAGWHGLFLPPFRWTRLP
jgi:hypothetical protein